MVKDFKYIIKRILIGVGIAFVLGYIGSLTGFLCVNVYAKENVPFKVGVYNTSGSNTNITALDGTYSNFFDNDSQNPLDTFSYYLFGVNTQSCNNGFCDMVSDPPRQWYSYNDLTENVEFPFYYQGDNNVTYLGSINYMFYKQFKLTNSNHYTIMLAIYKSSSDIRFNTNLEPNLTGLNVTLGSGTSERQILSNVENLQVTNHIYHSEIGRQSHWSTISVDFDLDSNFDSFSNGEDIWLSSLVFDINSPDRGYANIEYPFNNILYFPSNKTNDVYLKNYLYVIENGQIYYTDVDCDENSNSCHRGSSYSGNMDYTSYEDIEVINSIPVCGDSFTLENVICNIKRVFTMIEKFFVRISNFFKDLFDDSVNVDIDSNNDMTPVSNIVNMPLTMLNRFINGFENQCYTFNLGRLLGTDLFINCIDVESYLGSNLWSTIDILVSIFMCFNIMSLILMFFDKWTSFEDTFQLMYYPKHANTTQDYIPKHGGR